MQRNRNGLTGCWECRDRKFHFEKLEDRRLLAADFSPGVPYAPSQLWQMVDADKVDDSGDRIHVEASELLMYDVHETLLIRTLAQAPLESTAAAAQPITMILPSPDGDFQRFEVVESPIIAEQLAKKFPGIKTYRGVGVDDPGSTLRMDVTSHGFHAQVLSSEGTWLIDPFFHLEQEFYASYESSNALRQPGDEVFDELGLVGDDGNWLEDNHDDGHRERPGGKLENTVGGARSSFAAGLDLRTFETAVAATGEYTQFHGGTVSSGLAAIVTTMNRVNQIYERDIAARMILVSNNDLIVYVDGGTDPYTNSSGFSMLGENQANLDSVIGDANYDLGHVFSTGGGGVAGLGVIGVSGQKARGVTGRGAPVGDPFDIDYVAHEMGHQYGGRHTFNGDSGSCSGNRSGGAAYEPGSGSTIQAYAGICGNDDLQSNSDDMFHSVSIDEMRDTITSGAGGAAATLVSTANLQPTVEAGLNYTIPAGTPFALTAVGDDPDEADVLTYSWEERDLGPQQDVNAGDNGSSPLFRVWLPTTDPTRTFPRLSDLLNNTTAVGETLPTTNRDMDFRVVVRDNTLEPAGGIATDDMTVTVVDTGANFEITSQNGGSTWNGSSAETVTWNVAGTSNAPINTATVDVLFSADGGITFDTVLAAGVANDGSQEITVPNTPTTSGRIMVRAVDNIFFDVNDASIVVLEGDPAVVISQSGGSTNVSEAGAQDSYQITLNTAPVSPVVFTINADSQTEISSDNATFSDELIITKTNTSATTIFVRAVDDEAAEGDHIARITNRITDSQDSNYATSLVVPSVIADVQDDDELASEALVGVDFGPDDDLSPTNWTQVSSSDNTVSLSNLIYEDGTTSNYGLIIEELADGSWNTDDPTVNASTLPQHPNSLENIDGQIWTNSDPLQVTWTGLDLNRSYDVYVFGLEGFYDDIEQQVTITGADAPISFTQSFLQNDLQVNNLLGSSANQLVDYAVVVTPNNSGEIIINVDPVPGGNDVVLGAVAIAGISQTDPLSALGSKLLDGVISDGSLLDTFVNDGEYLEILPSPTSNPLKQNVDLIIVSEYFGSTPTSLDFVLDTKFSGGPQGDVIQQVELFDLDQRQWESVDMRSAMTQDSQLQIPVTGDISRFVNAVNGEVRARVSWLSPAFYTPEFDWSVEIDQLGWLFSDDAS